MMMLEIGTFPTPAKKPPIPKRANTAGTDAGEPVVQDRPERAAQQPADDDRGAKDPAATPPNRS